MTRRRSQPEPGRYARCDVTQPKDILVNPTDALDASSRIHLASIMSPERVKRQHASLVQCPDLPPYLIQTSLPDDVVTRLDRQVDSRVWPRFTVFPLASGPMLAVATVQAGDFQLRTAIPLVDLLAYAWLDTCIEREELAWLVEVPGHRQAMLVRKSCPFSNVENLRALLAQAQTPAPEELVINLATACSSLTQPDIIDSCIPGVAVKHAHVAMVWQALARPEMQAAVDAAVAALPKLN